MARRKKTRVMTVEAMSGLPFQAGGAVAAMAGRTAVWAISLYMRQPLRNTAVVALVGLSVMAGSNALYKQAHHHPAPLFGTFEDAGPTDDAAPPLLPAERPRKLAQRVSSETTGSVQQPQHLPGPVGTADVKAMQERLIALGMLKGDADGLFGPMTSRAVRAFEASVGRPSTGQLTPEIVALVRNSQIPQAPAETAVAAAPPLPEVTPPAVTARIATPAGNITARIEAPSVTPGVESRPLPAPSPLLPAGSQTPARTGAGSDPAAVRTAALEDEPAGVETVPMTRPNTVSKRSVQTIAVRAAAPSSAEQDMPDSLPPAAVGEDASTDPDVVAAVQRGLNSLGFLHAPVDGKAGEATAKAIRNFEVYFNYNVTGRVSRQLVKLLEQAGAVI